MKNSIYQKLYQYSKFFLFRIPPEWTHHAILHIFRYANIFIPYRLDNVFDNADNHLRTKLFNSHFAHPIGIAAGFDKYGDTYHLFAKMGASFCEVGTFTPKRQSGNSKPRLFRYPKYNALINRMGFNNAGIEKGLKNIQNIQKNIRPMAKLFGIPISIGKSKNTILEKAIFDYLGCLKAINEKMKMPLGFDIPYIAINISSPNTKNLRNLQDKIYLKDLLNSIKENTNIPIMIKLAPDYQTSKQYTDLLENSMQFGASGFILCNTSITSELKKKNLFNTNSNTDLIENFSNVTGGISGKPIQKMSIHLLKLAREVLPDTVPIISTGGVMGPQDIWNRLLLGANLVQVYTGLIFYGPDLIIHSVKYLKDKLKYFKISSMQEFYLHRKEILKVHERKNP